MHRAVWTMARSMAVLGGTVLVVLVLLTCLSVLGRGLNGFLNGELAQSLFPGVANWALGLGIGPILGHVELIEAGIAFAIFAFMPLCQLSGAHAKVNLFSDRLPPGPCRWLIAGIDVVFAAVLILIAWRLAGGLSEKREFSETTFMLQFPVWWAYGASLFASVMAALAGVYVAGERIVGAVQGHDLEGPAG